ncbi:MAG: hypothetical protein AB1630_01485 [bacterium]
MKRFITLLMFGVNLWAIVDPGPAYKYKPIWIPPDEGTSTTRILSIEEQKRKEALNKKFQNRFPEYTLSFDSYGVLKEIFALANDRFIKNPIFTGTYTIESLFSEFKDLFGIGTECLYNTIGIRSPNCFLGTLCPGLGCPHHEYFYRGLPVIKDNREFVNNSSYPTSPNWIWYSDERGLGTATWSLTVNYPYEIKDMDITPTITGTQAFEVAIDDLDVNFRKYNSNYKSIYELYDPAKRGFSKSFSEELELLRNSKKRGLSGRNLETYTITKYGIAELCILIHQNLKPYLAWKIWLPRGWEYYIDAKRGKVLYGYCAGLF